MTLTRPRDRGPGAGRSATGRIPGDGWQPPHLVTNPARDEVFRRAALLAVRSRTSADGLERDLRERYPRVRVHERLLSAEPHVIWYVYRDGRWEAPSRSTD